MRKVIVVSLICLMLGIIGLGYSVTQLETNWKHITSFTVSGNLTTNSFIAQNGHLRADNYIISESGYFYGVIFHEKNDFGSAGNSGYHPASSDGRLISSFYATLDDSLNEYYLEIEAQDVTSYTLEVYYDAGLQFSTMMLTIFVISIIVSITGCLILVFYTLRQKSTRDKNSFS